VEIGDNKSNNVIDNQLDNRLTDLNTRLERLERLIDNNADNGSARIIDNKSDNVEDLQSSDQGWVNLATIAAQLQVLPKSISGAFIKRGRDIGNDTIEIEIADRTICKKGKGMTALYQLK
jgi:TolA-binding protein